MVRMEFMSEAKKETGGVGNLFVLVLGLLLLIATFFVGRLSSQVEMLKDGDKNVAGVQTDDAEAVNPAGVAIDEASLVALADQVGLNMDDFDSCMSENKYEQKVLDDFDYGTNLGVSGTPTFFVGSVMIVGAQPQDAFEVIIDYELAGGDWKNPGESVAYLVDGDFNNGEIDLIEEEIKRGVGYVQGNSEAKIKMVEFSDFECPFCQRAQATIKAIQEKYGDDLSLEYRHYPLSFHPNAQKASEASECAGEQGKFWEMHDAIFGV